MRKWMTGVIVLFISCLIPFFGAFGWTGYVTADSLNLRRETVKDQKSLKY